MAVALKKIESELMKLSPRTLARLVSTRLLRKDLFEIPVIAEFKLSSNN